MGTEVTDKVLELAKEKNCRIITTPYDTFTASRLICQAMPVSYIMATDTIVSFNETDFVDDVKEEMTKKRFRYFPVSVSYTHLQLYLLVLHQIRVRSLPQLLVRRSADVLFPLRCLLT